MPLENNMSTPRSFVGLCGVLNQGMSFVTLVYIVLGFFGYLRYGEATDESITYNLPKGEMKVPICMIVGCILNKNFLSHKCLRYTSKQKGQVPSDVSEMSSNDPFKPIKFSQHDTFTT